MPKKKVPNPKGRRKSDVQVAVEKMAPEVQEEFYEFCRTAPCILDIARHFWELDPSHREIKSHAVRWWYHQWYKKKGKEAELRDRLFAKVEGMSEEGVLDQVMHTSSLLIERVVNQCLPHVEGIPSGEAYKLIASTAAWMREARSAAEQKSKLIHERDTAEVAISAVVRFVEITEGYFRDQDSQFQGAMREGHSAALQQLQMELKSR